MFDPVSLGIMGGTALLGMAESSNAANAQVKAAKESNALQKYMYDTTRGDFAPYREIGNNALYALSDYLGLPRSTDYMPQADATPQAATTSATVAPATNVPATNYQGSGAIDWAHGNIPFYGNQNGLPNPVAAPTQAAPAPAAPTVTAPPKFTNALEAFRSNPGYQFQLSEGQKAIDRGAAAKGNFGSGSYMKDLLRYSQGLADNTYGEYMNRLAGLSGVGQTQSNVLANIGQNYATNAGNNINAAGAARASGYLGQANTIMNTGNTLANLYANNQLYGGSPGVGIGQMPSNIAGYYPR